jgi:glycine/D-amino acid oxidase-like deaminating enzyme
VITAPRRPPVRLPTVNASWDRIIRTTIGLRPHRPSGFVLRPDKLDDKTLIHNYGHGGSGMSLSWGTASMATDLALAHSERRAAVLGSGVVGLTSARELQRHGFAVTIYAATVPPDTTSNMSLAGFTPTSGLIDADKRTPEWDAQFRQAVQIAYRRLQLLTGPKYGVSWVQQYQPTDNPPTGNAPGGGGDGNPLMPASIPNARVLLQPGEHPFDTKYAIERTEMRIEPSIYLDALMNDFLLWGGRVVIRKFDTPRDIAALSENVIVNCTGLGAKAIFNDAELMPLKGMLVVLIPQPEITYATNGSGRVPVSPEAGFIHMMPRSDGIILGGTSQRDVWTTEVDEKEKARVVDTHIALFNSMRAGLRT